MKMIKETFEAARRVQAHRASLRIYNVWFYIKYIDVEGVTVVFHNTKKLGRIYWEEVRGALIEARYLRGYNE